MPPSEPPPAARGEDVKTPPALLRYLGRPRWTALSEAFRLAGGAVGRAAQMVGRLEVDEARTRGKGREGYPCRRQRGNLRCRGGR